jgi:ABC-2 type transport system ATP-binding protein
VRYAIEATELSKVYGDGKKALDNFSLRVPAKSVCSLLGKNGAGKTTFTKIVSTILEPTSGEAQVLGYDLLKQTKEVRKRISIVPQEGRPFGLQTPFEHVFMFLVAHGWSLSDARKKAQAILDRLQLSEYKNKICSTLSGGLKQRVMIAMAAAVEPEMILLDEPTIGLDPLARIMIWDFVQELVDSGTTIFLTTHYMDEAETLSQQVTIMDAGKKVLEGTPQELKSHLKATTSVVISGKISEGELEGFGVVHRNGATARVFTDEVRGRELADYAIKRRLGVTLRPVTLEDLFIYLLGEADD